VTADEKGRVLRGQIVRLPDETACTLADGRVKRVGETWRYGNGPHHALLRVEGEVPWGGVSEYRAGTNEPRETFITHPKGWGRLCFDAARSGDPAKWVRVS